MAANKNMAADPTRNDMLVLVDGLDREIGTATKLETHERGLLHRAFSIVLTRTGSEGAEFLIARRAAGKYHSAGLWANSCCSHPRAGENLLDAAHRRVSEELGCKAEELHEIAAFAYRAEFENGLVEYEFDHVLLRRHAGDLAPDQAEVSDVRWIGLDELARELAEKPGLFAAWAPMVLTMAMAEIHKA